MLKLLRCWYNTQHVCGDMPHMIPGDTVLPSIQCCAAIMLLLFLYNLLHVCMCVCVMGLCSLILKGFVRPLQEATVDVHAIAGRCFLFHVFF